MTVKEIFELRKQGRIEESYEAIRPMYAVHKGKYTTLAMFWTGSDILRKRLREKRHTEARKVFEALLRVLPSIDDKDGKAHAAIMGSAVLLGEQVPGFDILSFIGNYASQHLTEADWQGFIPSPKEGSQRTSGGFHCPPTPSGCSPRRFTNCAGSPQPTMPSSSCLCCKKPFGGGHTTKTTNDKWRWSTAS